MSEWFADISVWFEQNWVAIVYVVVGMVICIAGGLLSLRPDPEKSRMFIPVYGVSMTIYLFGLALIVWQDELWTNIGSLLS